MKSKQRKENDIKYAVKGIFEKIEQNLLITKNNQMTTTIPKLSIDVIIEKQEFELNKYYVYDDNSGREPKIVKLIRKDNPHSMERNNEHYFVDVIEDKGFTYERLDYIDTKYRFYPLTKANFGFILNEFRRKKLFVKQLIKIFINEVCNQ